MVGEPRMCKEMFGGHRDAGGGRGRGAKQEEAEQGGSTWGVGVAEEAADAVGLEAAGLEELLSKCIGAEDEPREEPDRLREVVGVQLVEAPDKQFHRRLLQERLLRGAATEGRKGRIGGERSRQEGRRRQERQKKPMNGPPLNPPLCPSHHQPPPSTFPKPRPYSCGIPSSLALRKPDQSHLDRLEPWVSVGGLEGGVEDLRCRHHLQQRSREEDRASQATSSQGSEGALPPTQPTGPQVPMQRRQRKQQQNEEAAREQPRGTHHAAVALLASRGSLGPPKELAQVVLPQQGDEALDDPGLGQEVGSEGVGAAEALEGVQQGQEARRTQLLQSRDKSGQSHGAREYSYREACGRE